MLSAFLAYTILFTSLPPVNIDLPDWDVHPSLFDTLQDIWSERKIMYADAEDTPVATMTEDHFNETRSDTYTVSIADGIRTVIINNAAHLIEYSIAYNTFPEHHHDTDIVKLSTTNGTLWDLVESSSYMEGDNDCGGFQSIGSSELPFKGKIQLNGTDTININIDKPFLGTVEQCAEVCALNLSRMKAGTIDKTPILANQIINNTSATIPLSVNINLVCNTNNNENTSIQNYSGIIGTIADNTAVSLTVSNNMTHSTYGTANVEASGSVGFLCCTMGEKSSLIATINSGTNNNYSVTSSDGSAGGLVGTMANGSKLILANAGLNSITQSITGAAYAGGIVGEATGAYIGVTDPDLAIGDMTVTSNYKAGSTTLNGTTAAGYLFGSYTNTATTVKEAIEADQENNIEAEPAVIVQDRTFTIDSSFRNVALTFASNNAGGYFGVLNNHATGATVTFDGGIGDVLSYDAKDANKLLKINFGNGLSNQGGVIYKYSANDLTNTLYIYK